jgi:hypothetical protein
MHAREVIDIIAQRRPRIEQNWNRRDGYQYREQRGDLSVAEMPGARSRLGFVGEECGLCASGHGLTGSLFPAESTEMSDINHSGLHAAEPLPDDKSNECPSVSPLAVLSKPTYHVVWL